MAQTSRIIYILVFLAVCLIFYLAGPFAAQAGKSTLSTSNAEQRLAHWLEAISPAGGVSRLSRAYDAPAKAPVFEKMKPLVPFSPFPLGKPSSTHKRRLPHESTTDFSEVVFSFQEDMQLKDTRRDLAKYKDYSPHNYHANEMRPTFATLLSTRNGSLQEPYFLAVQSLVYRMLWSPLTSSKDFPFTVFVTPFVAQAQRDVLAGSGAIIRELHIMEWEPRSDGVPARLKDSFTKLHMWSLTEFPRIAFLDADTFPIKRIDDVFDITEPQSCVASRLSSEDAKNKDDLCEYVFAGVRQPGTAQGVNAGFLVIQPNKAMHKHLLETYERKDHYNDALADQGFLNWQFAQSGPFPAQLLPRRYNGLYPQPSDEGKLSVVHEKLWSWNADEAPWLTRNWNATWKEMVAFYDSERFVRARQEDDQATQGPSKAKATSGRIDRSEGQAGTKQHQDVVENSRIRAAAVRGGNDVATEADAMKNHREMGESRAQKADNHGLTPKQQDMLRRSQNGKLQMNFAP